MPPQSAAVLEILYRALMLFSRFARGERAKITALSGFWVLLSRIKTKFTRFQLAYHGVLQMPYVCPVCSGAPRFRSGSAALVFHARNPCGP